MPKFTPAEIKELKKQNFTDEVIAKLEKEGRINGEGPTEKPVVETVQVSTIVPAKKARKKKSTAPPPAEAPQFQALRLMLGDDMSQVPEASSRKIRAPQLQAASRIGMAPAASVAANRLSLADEPTTPGAPKLETRQQTKLLMEIRDILSGEAKTHGRERDNDKEDRDRARQETVEKKSPMFQRTRDALTSSKENVKGAWNQGMEQDAFGKILNSLLLDAIGPLAKGAAVAGAALAGWEMGKWLDEKSGNQLSGAVEKFAKWWMHVPSDRVAAGLDVIKPQSNEQARLGIPGSGKVPTEQERLGIPQPVAKVTPPKPALGIAPPQAPSMRPVLTPQRTINDTTSFSGNNVKVPSTEPSRALPAAPPTPPQPIMPAEKLHMSNDGIAKLKSNVREGVRLEPYWDVNGWAIGYGDHEFQGQSLGNDKQHKPAIKITAAEADQQLRAHLPYYEGVVRGQLKGKSVSQNQFDSLVSVSYNNPKAGQNLARRVAAGEKLTAQDFLVSATVKGQKNAGLEARRSDEFAQFRGPVLASSPSPLRAAAPLATPASIGQSTQVIMAPAPQVNVMPAPVIASRQIVPIPIAPRTDNPTLAALQFTTSIG